MKIDYYNFSMVTFSASLCPVTDAGNQLVAQEAVRKPSTLRRPPARTGESISSKSFCFDYTTQWQRCTTHKGTC